MSIVLDWGGRSDKVSPWLASKLRCLVTKEPSVQQLKGRALPPLSGEVATSQRRRGGRRLAHPSSREGRELSTWDLSD